VAGVQDIVIPRTDGGSVPARAYTPAIAAEPPGCLLWLHGDGWCVGDIEGFDRAARRLANASGAVTVSVGYRLAPEDPHPAAVQDADAAVAWAAGHGARQLGFDPGLVAVGGDSAGGNLAAVAARHAREALRLQVLVYPAVDASMGTGSYDEFRDGPMLRAEDMRECWAMYAGEDGADPDVSPLRAGDLAGLPPAYVAIAGHDVLRDEGLAYAEALRAAGVAVQVERYDDMVHGFLRWGGMVDRAHELVRSVGDAVRGAFASA